MTHSEIITKAIEKAIAGGWQFPFDANSYEIHKYIEARPEVIAFGSKEDWQDGQHLEGHWSIPELIFNHGFARALWPERDRGITTITWPFGTEDTTKTRPELIKCNTCNRTFDPKSDDWHDFEFGHIGCPEGKEQWQYHLQMMVIADDPIAYLGKHLD